MPLYDKDFQPHKVDIYLPAAPTRDAGGGVKLNWQAVVSQANAPCRIANHGGSSSRRQDRPGTVIRSRVSFKTDDLEITLVEGTKFVIVGINDAGRTLIIDSFENPTQPTDVDAHAIPAFTYCNCSEYR